MLPENITFRDPLADLQLGHTLVDWSNPNLGKDDVTCQMLGIKLGESPFYWGDEEFSGLGPLQIEAKILRDAKRAYWWGDSKYEVPYFQHMLRLAKLMFPETDITPSLYDVFNCFCRAVGGGNRKALHLIGSQSSGKSFGSCLLAFVCMCIEPETTNVFIANPHNKASLSQEWGTCLELWGELKTAHPTKDHKGCRLFPDAKEYEDKVIKFVPGLAKAGAMRVQGVKDEGSYRGIKAVGKDVERGVILLIVGEINLISNHSFYDMIDNLSSQDAFVACSSQNFRDPADLGGVVTEPSGLFGGPKSFEDLDIEKHQFWHGSKGSLVLRFDGHNSPNILSGRTIYPKLFKKENLQTLLEFGGEKSPAYFSQVRSFPVRGSESNSVLSKSKISQSRHADPFFVMKTVKHSLLFCDPAFGGNDNAKIGGCFFGDAETKDPEGNPKMEELIIFQDYFHNAKLVKDATVDEYWLERMKKAFVPLAEFTLGAELSYEDQIAIQCKEWALKWNVPPENVGFDFSMRPDIVSSMHKVFGFQVNAFDYNRNPEGYELRNLRANSLEVCKDRNTELHFLAADFFLTKQVRSAGYIENAILQLSRTQYEMHGKKYKSESKPEYKARFQNRSPDDRDTLCGLAGLAARRGFRQNQIATNKDSKPMWLKLQESGKGIAKTGRKL